MNNGFIVCKKCKLIYPAYISELIKDCPRCNHISTEKEQNITLMQKVIEEVKELKKEEKAIISSITPIINKRLEEESLSFPPNTIRVERQLELKNIIDTKERKTTLVLIVSTIVLAGGLAAYLYLHSIGIF